MQRFLVFSALLALCVGAQANTCVPLQAGATDQSVYIEFIDESTGFPTAGLAFNESGIDLEYVRSGAAATDITEATQTAGGAHSDGGFVSVGHGRYRLDLPDAAVASGVPQVVVQGVITGYIMLPCVVALSPPANVHTFGGTTVTGRDIGASVLLSSGTGTGQLSITSGLLAWNAAWDTEVQSEVTDGLNAYDPPTNAELVARTLATADYATATALAVVDQNVDDIETDTADMQPKLGTFSDLGAGATLSGNLEDMRDNGTATFDRSTDSLQAIRDRGDAAWTTGGAGGDPSIQSTTVASVTSQTILVPTATPTFVDQINGWAVYLEDAGDADAYHLTTVTDYDQSTGAVTIAQAAPFTVASSDTMVFLPAFMDQGVDVTAWNGTALSTTNPLPNAAPAANGGLPTVDANNRVAGIQGTITTLDGLDTAQDTQHSTTQSRLPAALVGGRIDATVDGTGLEAGALALINGEVDTALSDIHLDHLFATDYDPASKPGTGTALLNELVQSDGGVSQFTANALETAPSGSSITDWTADERTAISAILGIDGTATPADPSAGILDTIRDDTVDLQSRVPAALVGGRIDATVDGTGMEAGAVSAIQSGLATSAEVGALNDLSSAEAEAAAAAALTAYDPPTDTEMDAAFATYLEQQGRVDAAIVNCTVNTANFAGSSTTVACILTDRDGGAITAASGDLEGKELLVLSGAQIYEGRFINDSTWDGVNSELRLTLSRALPGTLADAVTAIIR